MCGITGYINFNKRPVKNTARILRMMQVQKHRGPNDSGVRAFSLERGASLELPVNKTVNVDGTYNALLGFNRLSILDLSPNGHQPMLSPDGKVILAMNGEIYNAFDMKPEMVSDGYPFISTTDTEVVLALYLKYGFKKMIEKLNGMFAIVIVDLRNGILYIARDRFGIKPMYYIAGEKLLAFSSELKSFRYLEEFRFELDEDQLDEFLIFRNNLNSTLYKKIQSLLPGHYLVYRPGSELKMHQYFDINHYRRRTLVNSSIEDYQAKLESLLARSVKSQLMSDVKLGGQLSGGVDSSVVTWYASKTAENGKFESVSIVFDDKRFTEEPYIDKVANKLGIVSHKFLLHSAYYLNHIEKATWHFEAPINHPNTIGIYLLSQRARDHVTVLLSGEGADELFGGYQRYYDVCFPYMNKRFIAAIINSLKYPGELFDYFDHAKRAVMATVFMPPSVALSLLPSFNLKKALATRSALYATLTGSVFTKQVKYEMQTYLPDLLIRQDKMSMAHSIENRVPFLDNEVVAASFTIPENFLVMRHSPEGFNTGKYLLKKIAANMFGNDFAFRNKMGFGIPLKEFFSEPRFLVYLRDKVIPGMRKRGIMNYKLVEGWLNNLPGISYRELESLWIAISFEIWASTYFDLDNENWNTPH
ncbi:asparagine synthase (glutamine-hydrolyzing) [Calditrichota bacterium GD2]